MTGGSVGRQRGPGRCSWTVARSVDETWYAGRRTPAHQGFAPSRFSRVRAAREMEDGRFLRTHAFLPDASGSNFAEY